MMQFNAVLLMAHEMHFSANFACIFHLAHSTHSLTLIQTDGTNWLISIANMGWHLCDVSKCFSFCLCSNWTFLLAYKSFVHQICHPCRRIIKGVFSPFFWMDAFWAVDGFYSVDSWLLVVHSYYHIAVEKKRTEKREWLSISRIGKLQYSDPHILDIVFWYNGRANRGWF